MCRGYRDGDHADWLRMRRALWDDCPDDRQVREMEEILASDAEEVFFAEGPGRGASPIERDRRPIEERSRGRR